MSNEDGSGPAFPAMSGWSLDSPGFSQRAYAAIHLRVPDSGLPWLDAMIERTRRDEFAKAALVGLMSNPAGAQHTYQQLTEFAHMQADAMLAQGRKG